MLTELALTLLKFWVREQWTKVRNITDNKNVNFCFSPILRCNKSPRCSQKPQIGWRLSLNCLICLDEIRCQIIFPVVPGLLITRWSDSRDTLTRVSIILSDQDCWVAPPGARTTVVSCPELGSLTTVCSNGKIFTITPTVSSLLCLTAHEREGGWLAGLLNSPSHLTISHTPPTS